MASSMRNSIDEEPVEVEVPMNSSPQSLSKAVYARRDEYTRPQRIKIKIGCWNVAACPGTEKDLAGWFVQGKGIDKQLAGYELANAIEEDDSQAKIESVDEQESRRKKKESTIPLGDEGVIAGGEDIGLYILGLQEVVELTSAREYIGKVYSNNDPVTTWRKSLSEALPEGYTLVAEQQLSGLLMFIFASPTVAPTISSVSTVSVGTGFMGYLGNKGAVTTRIVLGETTRLVFVNSHLASGTDKAHLERRVWDVSQILQRTHFDPISRGGVLDDGQESIGDEDFAFWFGDLNFRLEGLPGDDIRRLLMLHTKGEYDTGTQSRKKIDSEIDAGEGPIIIRSIDSEDESEEEETRKTSSSFDQNDDSSTVTTLPDPDEFIQDPSQDPGSLQATIDSLLPHDQLRHVQKSRKAFHDGWREGPVTFLPTYKYDVGRMGVFDSSEKKRAPSWCDRILFRTRRDKLIYDAKMNEEESARRKDEEMRAQGMEHAADDEDVLFSYDPDEDGEQQNTPSKSDDYDEYDETEDNEAAPVITRDGFGDRINLDVYTSHQRVLSSDHKPLDAVFTLEYDAVVPELKSKVQQEVARDLDRAENESRPGITIVVDHSQDAGESQGNDKPRKKSNDASGVVDFGDVQFDHRKTRNLTIANTSQVTSTFAFVGRPGIEGQEDRIAPPWLSVCFVGFAMDEDDRASEELKREITLEPGDAINVVLEVLVDDFSSVKSLNDGDVLLEDVLVLRVTDGRDHFVPIKGTWLQSCLGRSIDELIHIPEGGVRALLPRPRGEPGPPVNRGQEVTWSAPRELLKLTQVIDSLTDRVVADSNMLEGAMIPRDSPGWPFDERTWRFKDKSARVTLKGQVLAALDSDQSIFDVFPVEVSAAYRLEIVAEVLILFLRSLTDGIMPTNICEQIDADRTPRARNTLSDIEETKGWILDVLSSLPHHNISFVFLTSTLSRVAGELAPIPKVRRSLDTVVRSGFGSVKRTMSWKGRTAPPPEDPAAVRRGEVNRAFAEAFVGVVFRGNVPVRERDKRILEEKRGDILEAFLKGFVR
ncbi:hypothetical protein NHQ30_005697 [Ciborinia camelliae]|nr:hypothetical protein NHQ30_005697 [Ciborinia camelliae]